VPAALRIDPRRREMSDEDRLMPYPAPPTNSASSELDEEEIALVSDPSPQEDEDR
jgi:hypothetical protein